MRVATSEEQDRLFGFTPALFQRLEELQSAGAGLEELIGHLRQSGVPRPVASLALLKINAVSGLLQARSAVDGSLAYAKWPEVDESYPEVFRVYDKDGRQVAESASESAATLAA
jgi:hypothetical protein